MLASCMYSFLLDSPYCSALVLLKFILSPSLHHREVTGQRSTTDKSPVAEVEVQDFAEYKGTFPLGLCGLQGD